MRFDSHASEMTWLGIHNQDARGLLHIVPKNKVDLILTSPPYADLKDYGYQGQIGFRQDYVEYLDDMQGVLEACYCVARNSATLWVVADTFKKNGSLVPLPFDLAQRASNAGWLLQDIIIWNKAKNLPWSHRGRLPDIFEYILMFSKSKFYKYYPERIKLTAGLQNWWVQYPERYNPRGRIPHNIWCFPIPTQGSWGNGVLRHFNPFPPALVERIVELTTDLDDVVLDPFAGSGTVLAQAKCMGRKAVGFELNPHFAYELYPAVEDDVKRLWEQHEASRETEMSRSEQFNSLIVRMRKVKFAKKLLQSMAVGDMDDCRSQILSVLLLDNSQTCAHDLPRHKIAAIHLVMVTSPEANMDDVLSRARSACGKRPLSKYGLHVSLDCIAATENGRHEVSQLLARTQPWFVYTASAHHSHAGAVARKEILSFLAGQQRREWIRKGLPPVFSQISVELRQVEDFAALTAVRI